MKTLKQIGIWMDHSTAYLMELRDEAIIPTSVASEFTLVAKKLSMNKNENLMHNKEQQQQSAFYKKITESIRNFQEVLLFGPTDAKHELVNLLKTDHFFDKIKIEVKDSDKMTDIEMENFVREHFK